MGIVKPNSYCHFCGHAYSQAIQQDPTELFCGNCERTAYLNAVAVAVLLVPVCLDSRQTDLSDLNGLYTVRRGIEPQKGNVALPGGFVKKGEDWRVAAARELKEEVQIIIPSPETSIVLFDAKSVMFGDYVLIFGIVASGVVIDVQPFAASREAQERLILQPGYTEPLAFASHDEMARSYFDSEGPNPWLL